MTVVHRGAVERIAAIVVCTTDVARLAAFYIEVLGFDAIAASGRDAQLDLGGTRLVLRAVAARERVDVPGWDARFQHCAIAVADMPEAMRRLDTSREWTAISTDGPETLPANTGGVAAFKFRDPDGNPLELLDLHEAAASDALFIRIDHTAISVAEVDRSVAFYERAGFVVSGRTVNSGVEQSRLDGIVDAVVDVVALQTPSRTSPHLELLAYRGAYDRRMPILPQSAETTTRMVFDGPGRDDGDRPSRDPDGHAITWTATRPAADPSAFDPPPPEAS